MKVVTAKVPLEVEDIEMLGKLMLETGMKAEELFLDGLRYTSYMVDLRKGGLEPRAMPLDSKEGQSCLILDASVAYAKKNLD